MISNSPEEKSVKKDQGVSLNSSYFWKNNSRLGLSAYQGRQSDYDRTVFGPYATISITEKLFLNSELFLQDKTLKTDSSHQRGYATFSRLGYEAVDATSTVDRERYVRLAASYAERASINVALCEGDVPLGRSDFDEVVSSGIKAMSTHQRLLLVMTDTEGNLIRLPRVAQTAS